MIQAKSITNRSTEVGRHKFSGHAVPQGTLSSRGPSLAWRRFTLSRLTAIHLVPQGTLSRLTAIHLVPEGEGATTFCDTLLRERELTGQ